MLIWMKFELVNKVFSHPLLSQCRLSHLFCLPECAHDSLIDPFIQGILNFIQYKLFIFHIIDFCLYCMIIQLLHIHISNAFIELVHLSLHLEAKREEVKLTVVWVALNVIYLQWRFLEGWEHMVRELQSVQLLAICEGALWTRPTKHRMEWHLFRWL